MLPDIPQRLMEEKGTQIVRILAEKLRDGAKNE
jgi:hypothetical protein